MNLKFRFVCATRVPGQRFFSDTALGRSLQSHLQMYRFASVRLFPENSLGLSTVYNTALREAASDPAVLIFAHDDLHLCDHHWPYHMFAGLARFDVLGLAGNKRRVARQPSWNFVDDRFTWDGQEHLSGAVAHGKGFPPANLSYFGPPFQEAKLLDGLMLVAKSETLLARNISFDERFDFHFYDMDFCRTAEVNGLRMGTWTIAVIHESAGAFGTPAWRAAYERYLDKWAS